MAEQGSNDARLHAKHAAEIAHLKRNLDNTMTVVQRNTEDISEMKRDIKVAKSTWMRDQAQKG